MTPDVRVILIDQNGEPRETAPIIAVDFDGCLCEEKWPSIGAPQEHVIARLKDRKAHGYKIILWTCRCGEMLAEALIWCMKQGICFDAVNENLPERIEIFGTDSRKISAEEYWDDKAVRYNAKERCNAL